jgi:hypothetical protein
LFREVLFSLFSHKHNSARDYIPSKWTYFIICFFFLCLFLTHHVYKSTLTNGKQAKPLVFDNRGPSLQDFLLEAQLKKNNIEHVTAEHVPYLEQPSVSIGAGSKYYVEVYGCQVSSKEYPCILIIHDEC